MSPHPIGGRPDNSPAQRIGLSAYRFMPILVPSAPPVDRFKGMLGPELVVLNVPIVRSAQRVDSEMIVETADGPVNARVGDFVVTTDDGEHYAIPSFVFYGTVSRSSSCSLRLCERTPQDALGTHSYQRTELRQDGF